MRHSFESCSAEALKYSRRVDFRKGNVNSYNAASRNGWLNDICCHMLVLQIPREYWTQEKILEESLKYKTRTDFIRGSRKAYKAAQENGWLDILPYGKVKSKGQKQVHTYGETLRVAKSCVNKTEFIENYAAYRTAAGRHGWLKKIYFECGWVLRNPADHWSYDECKDVALRYDNMLSFRTNEYPAYIAITKKRWMELTSHMVRAESSKNRIIYEIADHSRKIVYVGLTFDLKERQSQHRRQSKGLIKVFGDELTLTPITDRLPKDEASEMEKYYISHYRLMRYTVLNKHPGGGLGGNKCHSRKVGIVK